MPSMNIIALNVASRTITTCTLNEMCQWSSKCTKITCHPNFIMSCLGRLKSLNYILKTEVIGSIWSQDPDQDHFYALGSLNNEFKVLKVEIRSGNILKKLKWNKNI